MFDVSGKYYKIVESVHNDTSLKVAFIIHEWLTEAAALADAFPPNDRFMYQLSYTTWTETTAEDREDDVETDIASWLPYDRDGLLLLVGADASLAELKDAKAYEISQAASAMIYEGFASNALSIGGTETEYYGYPNKTNDQANLVAAYSASLSPSLPVDWAVPLWCVELFGSETWGFREHTPTQLQAVGEKYIDDKTYIQTRNVVLQAEIEAAVDAAEVAAIVWTDTW